MSLPEFVPQKCILSFMSKEVTFTVNSRCSEMRSWLYRWGATPMQTRGGLELLPLLFERVHPVAQADLPDAGAEGGDGLWEGDAPPG